MYHYTKKINGKKYSLATWTGDPASCLRIAECVFSHHGLTGGMAEWDTVTKQKCYAGNMSAPRFLFLTDSLREAHTYHHNELIRSYVNMKGASAARSYLLELYQEDPEWKEDISTFFRHS